MLIEVSTAITLFLGRVLLLIEEKDGWIVSIIGGILSLVYLVHSHMYVYMIAQSGFVLMNIYGLLNSKSTLTLKTKKRVFIFLSFISLVAGIIITLSSVHNSATYLLQSFTSIIIMWSAYFIADKREIYGWLLFVIGNSLFAYISYNLSQDFFASMQIATAILALCGVYKYYKKVGEIKKHRLKVELAF